MLLSKIYNHSRKYLRVLLMNIIIRIFCDKSSLRQAIKMAIIKLTLLMRGNLVGHLSIKGFCWPIALSKLIYGSDKHINPNYKLISSSNYWLMMEFEESIYINCVHLLY